MPETRSTFDASQCLEDVDGDIANEYNTILDAAVAARDKYAKLMTLAQKLKRALVSKQAEFNQHAGHYQHDVAYHRACAETARDTLRVVRRLSRSAAVTNIYPRICERPQKTKHLCCNICMDNLKNVVTRCGHGYCTGCLATWLRPTNNDDAASDESDMESLAEQVEAPCPTCRRILNAEEDVWPIFMQNGGSIPEVVCVDSDDD
ncbi:uncharacterized protein HMPREF1541_04242 [Cyphellophora europaea CBS 101466]|uniref:RING-type domain-containing protein n=1 Tax=Cyphellophora europaea (strain CBS 101466) TaxID=1220924 RepID=W2S0Q2_CYPE1|nr:uncharacterized protein HMPREF1541_04242 [Cyphellophora europaea CBS 101466]ETN42301.1 hypothetical protein HMPREF1541_04242 [Cyphellophora europaea CBS 101466]